MKLIQTKDYLLLIDEEAEIKEGNYYLTYLGNIYQETKRLFEEDEGIERFTNRNSYKCILAYYPLTEEAKELDLPLLPNPFKNEVDTNIQTRNFNKQVKNPYLTEEREYQVWERAYIEGFNDGLTQSKQFSLEDVKHYLKDFGLDIFVNVRTGRVDTPEEVKEAAFNYAQSLSTQQLPSEFIPEYEIKYDHNINIPLGDYKRDLKTITNSGGKQELVGTYK